MRRRALHVVATAILMLATAASASAAPPPKSLTHKYPLGTQTLCCQSQAKPATQHRSAPSTGATPAPSTHTHGTHDNLPLWLPIALIAPAVLVFIFDRLPSRRTRGRPRRPRREVPPRVLFALRRIYRYDWQRDAWVLRRVGARVGPVLRPMGYRSAEPQQDDDQHPAPDLAGAGRHDRASDSPDTRDTPDSAGTPDPFKSTPASRPRPRRADRGAVGEEPEPPPLAIRPRKE
jgi:hypothetical protein